MPDDIEVGDFNRDGIPDLVTANYLAASVSVLLGNGVGGFGAAANFSVGFTGPSALVVGDFNRDGNLDLATANHQDYVEVLLGNGSGGFGLAHGVRRGPTCAG